MTEQTGTAAGPLPSDYVAQAAQAVGQVQADPGTEAGETLEQIKANAVRAALGDFEQKLAAQLAAAAKAFDEQKAAFEAQLTAMGRQLATVRAQAGPPDAVLLSQALATRVQSIATANPDLGALHFAGVISQAAQLAEHVKAIADGQSTDTAAAEQTANGIAAWFGRVHPRISGKFLEGAHVAADELERIIEALPALLPAVTAVAAAV